MADLRSLSKRVTEFVRYVRRGPLTWLPVPCRLPYGSWFLAYGDDIGGAVLRRSGGLQLVEEGEWRFVAGFLQSGMTFVDVGANQGFFTLLASRCVGPGGHVIAFEPTASVVRKLRRNLSLNGCKNVLVEPVALGAECGTHDFHICLDGRDAYNSLRPQGEDVKARRMVSRVPMVTLDAYVNDHRLDAIDFIKMDIEGGELEALRGGAQVLQTKRPVVMCELADIRTERWGYVASEIYRFLSGQAYSWFAVNGTGLLRPSVLRERYSPEWMNLIAVPQEKLLQITPLVENPGKQ